MLPATSLLGFLKLGQKVEYLRGISSISIARAPELAQFPTLAENDPARRYCVQAVVEALDDLGYLMQEFKLRKSMAVSQPLGPMVLEMKQYLLQSQTGRNATLNDHFAQKLVENAKALGAMIEVEVAERRTVELDFTAASEPVVGLVAKRAATKLALSPAETRLWDDAVRAICSGAGRAAVLAAWDCCWSLTRRMLGADPKVVSELMNKGLGLAGHNCANVSQLLAICAELPHAEQLLSKSSREELGKLAEDRHLLAESDADSTPPVLRGYLERVATFCGGLNA